MWRTIRIDEQVYKWLQSLAIPFDDNPNSVLRRLAGLDKKTAQERIEVSRQDPQERSHNEKQSGRRARLATGKELITRWKIPARQARFHRDGSWYERLSRFPAAYCDCNGYILFETGGDVQRSSGIRIEPSGQVWVPDGISTIPGYRRVEDPIEDPDKRRPSSSAFHSDA